MPANLIVERSREVEVLIFKACAETAINWSESSSAQEEVGTRIVVGGIPRFMWGDQNTAASSDRFMTNASYLSLENINLGE